MEESHTLDLTKILYNEISNYQVNYGLVSDDFVIEVLKNLYLYYSKNELTHEQKKQLIGLGVPFKYGS